MFTASNVIDIKVRAKPREKASNVLTCPIGNGLLLVLSIFLSRSDSYHIFNAPAAPAPREIAKIINKISYKLVLIGDIIKPTKLVKMTRDMTLGFNN